jgi:hypothetical protein
VTGVSGEPLADLADLIHAEQCTRHQPCGYDRDTPHRQYYRDAAEVIAAKLEPEIGAANVMLAVKVVLDELW